MLSFPSVFSCSEPQGISPEISKVTRPGILQKESYPVNRSIRILTFALSSDTCKEVGVLTSSEARLFYFWCCFPPPKTGLAMENKATISHTSGHYKVSKS